MRKQTNDIYETDRIWFYGHLRHTTTENMTTMEKIDTSELMKIMSY